MNLPSTLTILIILLAIADPAIAQGQETQPLYAYATYFVCTPEGESRADEIIKTSFKPHYDAAVEHGDISSWSWLQHFVGGYWRRVLVVTANNMDSLLDASGALGEIIEDQTPEAGRAFSGICSSHEDYIWESVPGVGTGASAGGRGDAARAKLGAEHGGAIVKGADGLVFQSRAQLIPGKAGGHLIQVDPEQRIGSAVEWHGIGLNGLQAAP